MVGIKDIAKKAGVSISTVSYALNGSPKVTDATRKRIVAIADELNYIPNMAARTLKTRETKIVGIYLANYSGIFYGQLLHGLTDTLLSKGYELIVCSGKKAHRFLPERMIDGAIILDMDFATDELLGYAERGHKIVVLDREIAHPNIRQVLLDNKAGATLAIDYLKTGFSGRFYLVTGPENTYDSEERLKAALSELERFRDEEVIVIPGDFSKATGEKAAQQIEQEWDGRPVAVFALNDEMAIGMYNYFAKTKLQIGRDVKLVGFDNTEVGQYLQPRLATIEYSKYKWGAVAAEKLLKLLEGEQVADEIIYTSLIPSN
ncbi:LacI family DNA-binding transcriptional regulator [Listeria booriae]|uniref:LacI family DNA-binding transcriptional regulator n=1 Tax=Listeria booriae TaxID=1552123 RepID=UPI001625F2C2|nr:LacI family DNA-binding transcriptional regulator [Listeria booriae]MBC1800652.1 LacI family transcriptional regulator [Listeria booriae]